MQSALVLLLLMAISPLARAGLITFHWTAAQTSAELLSGSGFWTIDETAIVPSAALEYAPLVTDFGFNWSTPAGAVALDPSNGFLNSAHLSFDAAQHLLGFTICAAGVAGPCGFSGHPSFQMIAAVGWGASTSDDQLFSVVFGNTPVTQTVSNVPEPGLLSLFALGLLMLAGARRRPGEPVSPG